MNILNKNSQGVLLGAVLGTIVGSISAALLPQRQRILREVRNQSKGLTEKAFDIGESVYNGVKHWSEPETEEIDASLFVKGALLGLLLGAGSALLLTPKTGLQLRHKLSRKYQDVADKTQEVLNFMHNNEHHPVARKKAASVRSAVKKAVHNGKKAVKSKIHAR